MQDVPLVINDRKYLTVRQFCSLTRKSESVVRRLLCTGNRIRKLKSVHISNHLYIPYEELTEYYFTPVGPPRGVAVRYRLSSDGVTYVPYETGEPSGEGAGKE